MEETDEAPGWNHYFIFDIVEIESVKSLPDRWSLAGLARCRLADTECNQNCKCGLPERMGVLSVH
jgi:hypothetical protein